MGSLSLHTQSHIYLLIYTYTHTHIRILHRPQNATHEPECSHVKHFCETNCLNILVHFSPVTVPVHCRLWNAEEGGVQSVGHEESGVLSGERDV